MISVSAILFLLVVNSATLLRAREANQIAEKTIFQVRVYAKMSVCLHIKVWAEKSKFSALLDADDDDVDLGSDNDEDDEDREVEQQEEEGETIQDVEKVEDGAEESVTDTKENEKHDNENVDADSEETQTQNVQENE